MNVSIKIDNGNVVAYSRRPRTDPGWTVVDQSDPRIATFFAENDNVTAAVTRRLQNLDPMTRFMLEDIAALRGLTLAQLRTDYLGRLP